MANEPRIDLAFHGSTRRHKVGTVLVGEPRETEFSGRISRDGVGFEELVIEVDAHSGVEDVRVIGRAR